MTTSIIVPLFNRHDLTIRCIDALAMCTDDYELILVDNGSTDETAGLEVTVRNPINRGFAKACNQGARLASGDHLVFLNNDTEVRDGWLPPLIRAGVCGPLLVYPDGMVQSAGVAVDFTRPFGEEAVNIQSEGLTRPVDAVTGACLSIPAELFRLLGGFDVGFWNGYEDVDLCLSALGAGAPVTFVAESQVMHRESQSDRTERFRCARQNIVRLRQKWSTL